MPKKLEINSTVTADIQKRINSGMTLLSSVSRPPSFSLSRPSSNNMGKVEKNSIRNFEHKVSERSLLKEQNFLKSLSVLTGGSKMLPSASVQIPYLAQRLEDLKMAFIDETRQKLNQIREIKQKEIDQFYLELCYVVGCSQSKKLIGEWMPSILVKNLKNRETSMYLGGL